MKIENIRLAFEGLEKDILDEFNDLPITIFGSDSENFEDSVNVFRLSENEVGIELRGAYRIKGIEDVDKDKYEIMAYGKIVGRDHRKINPIVLNFKNNETNQELVLYQYAFPDFK